MTGVDAIVTRSDRRFAAPLAAVALLALLVGVSPDFGATWDERFQQKYGEQIWDYLHGRLPRTAFDTDFGNQYLYGGLFEVIAVAVQQVVPANRYVVRHGVNAVFGWVGIVFCGLLAARLFGPGAGWLAALLLAASPRYVAHSMNNPKDVPFAALAIVSLYYIVTMSPRPPHLTWRHAAKLTLAIALAIGVRPLGLVLLGLAAAALTGLSAISAIRTLARAGPIAGAGPATGPAETAVQSVAGALGRLAIMALVAVPLGTLAWPWAQGQPFARPVEAFLIASRATWAAGFPVLYAGQHLAADQLPWQYVPVWLGMSLPPVVLAGLALVPLAWRHGSSARIGILALATFVVAPIALAIWRHATLYDEIRHLLFTIPPLVALAGAGWAAALGAARRRARTVAILALVAGVAEPLVFQVRNHPNQIVYFSPIAGGPRAAFGQYDMDYWGNSMLDPVKWAAGLAARAGMPVGVMGRPTEPIQANLERYPSVWFVGRKTEAAHFEIRLLRGSHDEVLDVAGRGDVIHRAATADGTPLSVVVPGPAFHELEDRFRELGLSDALRR